jgi:hypothetical protein
MKLTCCITKVAALVHARVATETVDFYGSKTLCQGAYRPVEDRPVPLEQVTCRGCIIKMQNLDIAALQDEIAMLRRELQRAESVFDDLRPSRFAEDGTATDYEEFGVTLLHTTISAALQMPRAVLHTVYTEPSHG